MIAQRLTLGCWLDQANYNIDDLNREVIGIAEGFGFKPELDLESELNDGEQLDWEADRAIDFLNDMPETPPYCFWAHDGELGAFGLWPAIETARESVAFVSSKEQDYPADDFRGEWLHISDHGNVTLYVRGDNGQDKEVWSVV